MILLVALWAVVALAVGLVVGKRLRAAPRSSTPRRGRTLENPPDSSLLPSADACVDANVVHLQIHGRDGLRRHRFRFPLLQD